MVFSSSIFLLVFLPIVFILNFLVKEKYSNALLLLASLFFYAWGEPILVLLMIITIVMNWLLGRILIKQSSNIGKKIVLVVALIFDLTILGYYKYCRFLISIINSMFGREIFVDLQISLPIGIFFLPFRRFLIS